MPKTVFTLSPCCIYVANIKGRYKKSSAGIDGAGAALL